jgi:2-iminoacetate synthase ThiH
LREHSRVEVPKRVGLVRWRTTAAVVVGHVEDDDEYTANASHAAEDVQRCGSFVELE